MKKHKNIEFENKKPTFKQAKYFFERLKNKQFNLEQELITINKELEQLSNNIIKLNPINKIHELLINEPSGVITIKRVEQALSIRNPRVSTIKLLKEFQKTYEEGVIIYYSSPIDGGTTILNLNSESTFVKVIKKLLNSKGDVLKSKLYSLDLENPLIISKALRHYSKFIQPERIKCDDFESEEGLVMKRKW